jgi:hypothetical protein
MRRLVALFLAAGIGIFGFAAGVALTGSLGASILIGAVVAAGTGLWAHAHPILAFDEAACPTALKVVSSLAAVMAILVLARLTMFMIDPSRVSFSFVPTSRWEVQHSCVSAYFVGAKSAASVPNIYADSLFTAPDDDPAKPRKPRMIGPFNIDVYEYPPPFLLLPRALRHVTPEFQPFRALWFALNGIVISLALLLVARALGPTVGTRALLLSPFVWLSLPMVSDLQKGNVQAMVIAASMIAMVLFERRHRAAGGALLAFASVGKLYPSLLCVYLLARREWRALAWMAAFSAGFIGLTFVDLGWAPFAAFRERLPGLIGGQAFPAFRNPAPTAMNFSIPGLVFKLKLFGVPGMSFGAMRIVGWFYTLVVGGATLLAGLRIWRDREKPLVWMAILILATLRSPFLPQAYAAIPALWLLTLVAATFAPTPKTVLVTLGVWAALNIYWPTDWPADPRLLAVASGVPQAITLLMALFVLTRTWEDPVPAAPR